MLGITRGTSGPAPEPPAEATRERPKPAPLRSFWQAAAGFWGAGGPRLSWALSAALLVIVLLNLAACYGMNVWHRAIFDALQTMDPEKVLRLSMLYAPLLAGSVLLSVMH